MIRATAFTLVALLGASPFLAAQQTATLEPPADLLARPAGAECLAAFSRNLYDALVARGFGHAEAVQLVVAFARSGIIEPDCRAPR